MCIKSGFKEICLKLATNGWSDKGFLLTSKVCPQRVFCPCPGAIYMYKIIKNVYKIRFQRDHFETCNIWAKRKGLSVVIKILFPMDCLPLPGAIYIIELFHDKTNKMVCAASEDWSAWASAQSDQSSLCSQWVAKDPSFLHADSKDSDQTGHTCHFFLVLSVTLHCSWASLLGCLSVLTFFHHWLTAALLESVEEGKWP